MKAAQRALVKSHQRERTGPQRRGRYVPRVT
jgi:hypothetical protein